ncbi:MAG: DUF1573 domain-containing protein [Planctomycetaceae bacterium]
MTLRICLTLALVAGMTGPARSDSTTKPQNWAEKMFSELEHDFGVVTKGSDVQHKIEIKNLYGEPITLLSSKSSCGCTTPELSTRILQPGEVGYLNLKLNTVRFSKHKNPNVDVQVSFGKSAITTVRIPVHAYIRDDVTTSSDTVDFGIVGAGQAAQQTVQVNYHGHNPWKITGVRDAGSGVSVEISKPRRTAQGLTYDIALSLSPEMKLGQLDRSLIILTEEPNQSYIPLRVKGTVEADIVVATPVVHLGGLTPGAEAKTRLIVRGRQPFAIEGVESQPGRVNAEIGEPAKKAVHVLPLVITAPAVPGKFTQKLLVKIANHPPVTCQVDGEVLSVPAKGGLVDAVK